MPIAKTANAAYKDYKTGGGTLAFTEWLHREKEKMYYSTGEDNMLLVNPPLNDTIQAAIKDTLEKGGLKTTESGKTIFGINKVVVIGGSVALIAGIIFLIVVKNKKVT